MFRYLYLKWSDEANWKVVRAVGDGEDSREVILNAKLQDQMSRLRYPHHTFRAEFKVE